MVTECNVVNWGGWNVASRFGFEFWIVGWKAKGERNETTGRHEQNGMNGSTLACVFACGLGQLFGFAFTIKIQPSKATSNVLPVGWVQKP